MFAPWKKSYDKRREHIKKQRHHFANKGLYSQSYGFFSSHVQMWELVYKGSWAPKKWCFQIVVLEKTLESPLDSKEIQRVHPKGHQPWILIGRTDAEAETPILWPLDVKKWLTGKEMLGKIEGRRRRGWQKMRWSDGFINSLDISLSELREMVKDREAWHAACSSWGCKESDMTYWLHKNNNIPLYDCFTVSCFLTHSPIEGYLGCFQFRLFILYSCYTHLNIYVKVFVWTSVSNSFE